MITVMITVERPVPLSCAAPSMVITVMITVERPVPLSCAAPSMVITVVRGLAVCLVGGGSRLEPYHGDHGGRSPWYGVGIRGLVGRALRTTVIMQVVLSGGLGARAFSGGGAVPRALTHLGVALADAARETVF